LQRLLEIDGLERLQQTLAGWVEDALHRGEMNRNPVWSESVAVGNPEFLAAFRNTASDMRHHKINEEDGICALREMTSPYSSSSAHKIGHLRGENRRFLYNIG